MNQVEQLLTIARGEVGVRESPPKSNNVKYNTWYYGRAVSGSNYAWCSTFVLWCFHNAGLQNLAWGTLGAARAAVAEGARNWLTLARDTGRRVTAGYIPGDVVVFDWNSDGRGDHVGIVCQVKSDGIVCIEGNTAIGNDSDGGEVMYRVRSAGNIAGAYRPKYETEDENMSYEDFKAFMTRYETETREKPVSDWARAVWEELTREGTFDGTAPRSPLTREQAATLIKRQREKK
jgi:hypothetical protein